MIKRNTSYSSKYLLYIIATPIGNLSDITLRALDILSEADIIACEDTRNTLKLLNHFDIKNKKLISLHEHNETKISLQIIDKIKQNLNICYVSDAGYPLISDPGSILVKMCLENDIAVSVIPGASAFLNALVGSNISTDHFYFYGFLAPTTSKRKKQLAELKSFKDTIIFYEAPHRLKETCLDIKSIFSNRKITICRELTKYHEEYIYLNIDDIDELDFESIKGEIVIVVEGNKEETTIDITDIEDEIKTLLETSNLKNNEIAKQLANKYNLSKNEIYDLILKIKS